MHIQESEQYLGGVVDQLKRTQARGPAIGPMHTGIIPPPADLRKGVPADAVLSPLAITLNGLRKSRYKMKTVSQIVVHVTSRGPVNRSRATGYRKPAVAFAVDFYLHGKKGFPHYVIDLNGTIYATCEERFMGAHAGWTHVGGAETFRKAGWRAPAWWLAVWSRFGFKKPLDLLPKGAAGPNSQSIGIELVLNLDLKPMLAQYIALARLIVDIERRHGLTIPEPPHPMLLGHEDFNPLTGDHGRADRQGGWDPGAHRPNPRFSWSTLWLHIRTARS